MSRPIFIQLGLFGGENAIAGMHVVKAHTRVQADGSEVFVGEHVRWNRGRTQQIPKVRANREVPERHPSLFDALPQPSADPVPVPEPAALQPQSSQPREPDAVPTEPMTDPDAVPTEPGPCPFGMPGATQLHFWETR